MIEHDNHVSPDTAWTQSGSAGSFARTRWKRPARRWARSASTVAIWKRSAFSASSRPRSESSSSVTSDMHRASTDGGGGAHEMRWTRAETSAAWYKIALPRVDRASVNVAGGRLFCGRAKERAV